MNKTFFCEIIFNFLQKKNKKKKMKIFYLLALIFLFITFANALSRFYGEHQNKESDPSQEKLNKIDEDERVLNDPKRRSGFINHQERFGIEMGQNVFKDSIKKRSEPQK